MIGVEREELVRPKNLFTNRCGISDNGKTLVVPHQECGWIMIYRKTKKGWKEEDTISCHIDADMSLALSGDGNVIILGNWSHAPYIIWRRHVGCYKDGKGRLHDYWRWEDRATVKSDKKGCDYEQEPAYHVGISRKGNTVIFSDHMEDVVEIHRYRAGKWKQDYVIRPRIEKTRSQRAASCPVALSDDGNVAVVCGLRGLDNVTIWKRKAKENWAMTHEFDIPFSWRVEAVDMSGDGKTIIVGEPRWEQDVYIYREDDVSQKWKMIEHIESNRTEVTCSWGNKTKVQRCGHAGCSVSISKNGKIIVIGDDFSRTADVWREGSDGWKHCQTFLGGAGYGGQVAVSGDGKKFLLVDSAGTDVCVCSFKSNHDFCGNDEKQIR